MENHHEQGKPRAVYETECRRLQHYRGYSVNKYGKVMLLIAAILILLMSGWLFLSDHLARQAIDAECAALVPNSLTTQRDYDNYAKKCLCIESQAKHYNAFKVIDGRPLFWSDIRRLCAAAR